MPVHSLPYTVDRNGRFHGRSGRFVSTEEVLNCYRETKLEAETAKRIAEEAALKVAKAVEEQERAEAGSVAALEKVSERKALLLQAGVGEPGPEYEDDSLATRRLWNLLKHDEANNKSGESSLENARPRSIRTLTASPRTAKMLLVLGLGQESVVKQWLRAADGLHGSR